MNLGGLSFPLASCVIRQVSLGPDCEHQFTIGVEDAGFAVAVRADDAVETGILVRAVVFDVDLGRLDLADGAYRWGAGQGVRCRRTVVTGDGTRRTARR